MYVFDILCVHYHDVFCCCCCCSLAFFIDGLSSLHVGSCDDIIISHASKIKAMLPWGQSETDKTYSKFRYDASQGTLNEYDLYYFKNHFKCVTSD